MKPFLFRFIRVFFIPILLICSLISPAPSIAGDYHLVGWLNTFVPGGGELVMGNTLLGAEQFGFEVSTFGVGYALSSRSTMTIDGVPEDYPAVSTSLRTTTTLIPFCKKKNASGVCIQYGTQSKTKSTRTINNTPTDLTKPIGAAFLQEVGLKAHMTNVFDAYREGYRVYGGSVGQGIDLRPTNQLFLDPFDLKTLSSPWVWIPLLLVGAATAMDYHDQIANNSLAPIQKLTRTSNAFVGFNQLVVYPIGSGAPEEMFYRGFIQNEAYHWISSPFFSIPVSTAAFAFSHSPEGRIGAAVSGSYLGLLAHKNKGNLAEGIAVHFWSVVFLGVESLLLTLKAQEITIPVSQFSFNF